MHPALARRGWKVKNHQPVVLEGRYRTIEGEVRGRIIITPSMLPGKFFVSFEVVDPPAWVWASAAARCLHKVGEKRYIVHWAVAPQTLVAGVFAIEKMLSQKGGEH